MHFVFSSCPDEMELQLCIFGDGRGGKSGQGEHRLVLDVLDVRGFSYYGL